MPLTYYQARATENEGFKDFLGRLEKVPLHQKAEFIQVEIERIINQLLEDTITPVLSDSLIAIFCAKELMRKVEELSLSLEENHVIMLNRLKHLLLNRSMEHFPELCQDIRDLDHAVNTLKKKKSFDPSIGLEMQTISDADKKLASFIDVPKLSEGKSALEQIREEIESLHEDSLLGIYVKLRLEYLLFHKEQEFIKYLHANGFTNENISRMSKELGTDAAHQRVQANLARFIAYLCEDIDELVEQLSFEDDARKDLQNLVSRLAASLEEFSSKRDKENKSYKAICEKTQNLRKPRFVIAVCQLMEGYLIASDSPNKYNKRFRHIFNIAKALGDLPLAVLAASGSITNCKIKDGRLQEEYLEMIASVVTGEVAKRLPRPILEKTIEGADPEKFGLDVGQKVTWNDVIRIAVSEVSRLRGESQQDLVTSRDPNGASVRSDMESSAPTLRI